MRLAVLIGLLATPAPAQMLDDRNLPVVPRTAADAAWVALALAPPSDFSTPEAAEALPAGAATVRAAGTAEAFTLPSANLAQADQTVFARGQALFRKLWIAAPSPITESDGLGPLYNARACQDCHLRDGRGHPPESDEDARLSMVLRLSVPGGPAPQDIAEWVATQPDPTYGSQLQDLASPGQRAEGRLEIAWTETPVTLADGTVISLRAPAYAFAMPAYGPTDAGLLLSARVAPQMIGLGLLEAIPAADILALADPEDADQDGISGRAQIVPSVAFGGPMLGRFGLKAGTPTLKDQAADALAIDMGLSSPLRPGPWGDCQPAQALCRDAPHGEKPGLRGGPEVDAESLDLLTFYSQNLGVPERRHVADPKVLRGKEVFYSLNCTGCHTPKHVTHRLAGQAAQSFQLIWPYTDLLLHDMGPGLADNRAEGRASGSEWRTPPLWGIGLTAEVSGRATFLHDGRARSLLEAILWHGGEAQAARDAVVMLDTTNRAALLAFLASL
jgi:CxxC motif-containing protein (DUF1111 family)